MNNQPFSQTGSAHEDNTLIIWFLNLTKQCLYDLHHFQEGMGCLSFRLSYHKTIADYY